MIRPSSLNIARHCQLSPWLAQKFPETNEAIERGNEVDRQVCADLLGRGRASDPDAAACLRWLRAHVHVDKVQEAVELYPEGPPFSMDFVTRGTPDVVGVDSWDQTCLVVVDLKKREQYLAARLALPDDNLQLHAYAIGEAQRRGYPKYRTALLLFGEGDVEALWSKEYTRVEWLPILAEIENICAQEILGHDSPPTGKAGPHCTDCYSRLHCPHWALVAQGVDSALEPLSRPAEITPEVAGRAYLALKAHEDRIKRAKEILKGYRLVRGEGSVVVGDKQWGPTQQPGHRTADVAALERDGLSKYIKKGQPYEQWRLTRLRRPSDP